MLFLFFWSFFRYFWQERNITQTSLTMLVGRNKGSHIWVSTIERPTLFFWKKSRSCNFLAFLKNEEGKPSKIRHIFQCWQTRLIIIICFANLFMWKVDAIPATKHRTHSATFHVFYVFSRTDHVTKQKNIFSMKKTNFLEFPFIKVETVKKMTLTQNTKHSPKKKNIDHIRTQSSK